MNKDTGHPLMWDESELKWKFFSVLPDFFHKLSRPLHQQLRLEMNPNQFWIMGGVITHGRLSMSEVSDLLCIRKQQATQLVDKMIAEGYLVRTTDDSDRRKIYVSPTEAGWALAQRGKEIVSTALEERLSKLDQEDYERLSQALDTINQILAKI